MDFGSYACLHLINLSKPFPIINFLRGVLLERNDAFNYMKMCKRKNY